MILIYKAKKNKRADALEEVNHICKEFGFTTRIIKARNL